MSKPHELEDEPLWDADTMAKMLGVKKKTLYTLVQRGQAPPSIRVGRNLRFVPRGYREWLDQREI